MLYEEVFVSWTPVERFAAENDPEWVVAERHSDRTVRTIKARPAPLSREEAHAVALSRELLASLEGLLNAALDCELPTRRRGCGLGGRSLPVRGSRESPHNQPQLPLPWRRRHGPTFLRGLPLWRPGLPDCLRYAGLRGAPVGACVCGLGGFGSHERKRGVVSGHTPGPWGRL